MRTPLLVLLTIATAATATAQWITHPTPNVPRLPDGRVNANAPAPRAADGRADFSGLWTGANTMTDPACAAKPGCIPQEPLPVQAVHIALSAPEQFQRLQSGQLNMFELIPYRDWAAEIVKRRAAFQQGVGPSDNGANVDQHARCLPPNYPRAWAFPHYRRIVQAPDRLVILHEFNASYRQVFTDARPLPDDPAPSWQGYSSGRWEGDTLVVETIGFRDDLWLDMAGSPLTSAAPRHRTHPPAALRRAGDRGHHQRPESVLEAVHRPSRSGDRRRHGTAGQQLHRERAVSAADGGRVASA